MGKFTQIGNNVTIQTDGDSDLRSIVIGRRSVIQDGCILRNCTIDPFCFIGAGSIISHGCRICKGSVITPGSILLPNVKVPKGEVWGGIPARKIRDVTDNDRGNLRLELWELVKLSRSYINMKRTTNQELMDPDDIENLEYHLNYLCDSISFCEYSAGSCYEYFSDASGYGDDWGDCGDGGDGGGWGDCGGGDGGGGDGGGGD